MVLLKLESPNNMKSPLVKILHSYLKVLGHYGGDISDTFTLTSELAVKDFQRQSSLTSTGEVDDATWSALIDRFTPVLPNIQDFLSRAETAKTAAETAKTAAETAKTAAETAKTAAETAKAGAEAAKTGAEAAKTAAETAKTGAETAKADAETAKTGAEAAETAKADAETAKADAETAKADAETAKTGAEAARDVVLAKGNAIQASWIHRDAIATYSAIKEKGDEILQLITQAQTFARDAERQSSQEGVANARNNAQKANEKSEQQLAIATVLLEFVKQQAEATNSANANDAETTRIAAQVALDEMRRITGGNTSTRDINQLPDALKNLEGFKDKEPQSLVALKAEVERYVKEAKDGSEVPMTTPDTKNSFEFRKIFFDAKEGESISELTVAEQSSDKLLRRGQSSMRNHLKLPDVYK